MTAVDIAITTGVGADTSVISGDHANKNWGAQAWVLTDSDLISKALVRFDLSSIPAGATCDSAILKLTPTANKSAHVVSVYQVADANGDWVEGTKSGVTAGTGEPCWNYKKYNTVGWAGSAGLATAGTDYINTVLASFSGTHTANTQIEIPFNAAGLAALAGMFGDDTNNGLLITDSTVQDIYYHGKTAATVGYRPVLYITYTESTPTGLVAADFTLNAVTFDAPVLTNEASVIGLVAKDLTLSAVTFDAPTLVNIVVTPPERTYTMDADSREYVISAESREYVIDADMRGAKIDIDSITKFRNEISYNGLTGADLTLAQVLFDNPELIESVAGFDFSKLSYGDFVTSLSATGCTVEDLGACSDDTNHIWGLHYGDAGKPSVLLTGCVQGAEWKNANMLVRFMSYIATPPNNAFQKLKDTFQFYAIPIMNPFDYIDNTGGDAENADGVHLLTDFGTSTAVEIVAVRDKFTTYKPYVFIDCHSSTSSQFIWFYKIVSDTDFWPTALVNINKVVPGSTGTNSTGTHAIMWASSQISPLCRYTTSLITEPNVSNSATVMSWAFLNSITQYLSTFIDRMNSDLLPANIASCAMIGDGHGTNNYGIYTSIITGKDGTEKWRSLLKLDVSGLPAGSTITDATICLTCTAVSDNTSRVIGLHKSLTEWFEGLRFANPPNASEDGSTWNLRNANGLVVWGTGAGTPGGLAGTDYEVTASATAAVTTTGVYSFDVTDDIQAIADGGNNYGWFVINADEATNNTSKTFASDEATTGKPYMILHYTV